MLAWENLFEEKQITAKQAAYMIKDGDRIMTGNRDCRAILKEIILRPDIHDVHYYVPICNYMMDAPNVGKNFFPATSFLNDNSHKLHHEGRFDFIPSEYWQWDKLATNILKCNVALIEVSKPDKHVSRPEYF